MWRRVDRAQDAERADREIDRHAVLVDGEPLRAHPAERHVGGADAVAAQHDRVERTTATHAHVHRPVSVDRRALAVAPLGDRTRPLRAGSASEASSTAASAQPAPRKRSRCRAVPHVDLDDLERRRVAPDHVGDAGRARDPDHAAAVGRIAGRDRRSLRSVPHDVLRVAITRTARPYWSASSRATRPTSVSTLPPNAPPLASGLAGSPPARTTTRPARGSPARPTSSAACAPNRRAARRAARSAAPSCDDPAPCALEAPGLGQRLADHPLAVRAGAGRRARHPARGRRRSRPAERDVRTDALAPRRPRGGPEALLADGSTAAASASSSADADDRLDDRLPAGASAQMGEHRLLAPPRGAAAARRSSAAARITMPGVQNPHWLPPWSANVAAPCVGVDEPLDRRHRAAGDTRRSASRTPPAADRRSTPCSTRTDLAGCSRPSPSARRATRAGRRAVIRRPAPRPARR